MEQERLDMTHHVFTLTLDGALCVTQLDNPQEILDIGTGTGMWVGATKPLYHRCASCYFLIFFFNFFQKSLLTCAPHQAIEMGDLFPSAEVIGTDLSPIQAEW